MLYEDVMLRGPRSANIYPVFGGGVFLKLRLGEEEIVN